MKTLTDEEMDKNKQKKWKINKKEVKHTKENKNKTKIRKTWETQIQIITNIYISEEYKKKNRSKKTYTDNKPH